MVRFSSLSAIRRASDLRDSKPMPVCKLLNALTGKTVVTFVPGWRRLLYIFDAGDVSNAWSMSGYSVNLPDGRVRSLQGHVFTHEERAAHIIRLRLPSMPPQHNREELCQGAGNRRWYKECREWVATMYDDTDTINGVAIKHLAPLILQAYAQSERRMMVYKHWRILDVPSRLSCPSIGRNWSWQGALHGIMLRSGMIAGQTKAFVQQWLDTYSAILLNIRQAIEADPFENYFP